MVPNYFQSTVTITNWAIKALLFEFSVSAFYANVGPTNNFTTQNSAA